MSAVIQLPTSGDTAALYGALHDAEAAINECDVDYLMGPDVRELIETLSRHLGMVSALQLAALRRLDEMGVPGDGRDRSVTAAIARLSGVSGGVASNQVRLARRLDSQHLLRTALGSGGLSLEQVALVSPVATTPELEQRLIDTAQQECFEVLREEVQRLKSSGSSKDEDSEDTRRDLLKTCRVKTNDVDGMGTVFAKLLPEEISTVKSVLDSLRDEIFRKNHKVGNANSFDINMADAFMALVEAASEHLSGNCSSGHKSRRAKYKATVIVDLEALRRGYRQGDETVEVAGCGQISVRRAKELLGDSLYRVLIKDGVDIKTVTSRSRYWKQEILTALETQQHRCQVPGCESTFRLQKDHIWPYAKDGPTSLANVRLLCPYHHALVSRGLFELVSVDGMATWRQIRSSSSPPESG